jgi:hypothetical protein
MKNVAKGAPLPPSPGGGGIGALRAPFLVLKDAGAERRLCAKRAGWGEFSAGGLSEKSPPPGAFGADLPPPGGGKGSA